MRARIFKGLILTLSIILIAGYGQTAAGAGYATIGDSLTDEYEFSDGGNHSAGRNWLEQLATVRGLDFGTFSTTTRGTPRNQGYEYNWARAGAETPHMLSEGQPEGVAGQILQGKIKLVCVMIGNNDFGHKYDLIYNNEMDWTDLVNDGLTRLHTALGIVQNAGPTVKIVLATIPDWELDPAVRAAYPDVNKRKRVRDAIKEYNRRIETDFAQWSQIVFVDLYQMSLDILAAGQLTVGGFPIDLNSCGDSPNKVILNDQIHPGTIVQGLIANKFVEAMNQAGENITPFSELEILNNAGIYRLDASVTGGHGQISPTQGFYTLNVPVVLTATPESGYRVKKWTGTNNDLSVSPTNGVTMADNKTVTVEFEAIPDTRVQLTTGVVGGHGSLLPVSDRYEINSLVTLTALPEDGYRVKQWTGTDNDATTDETNMVRMNGAKAVTVEFEVVPDTGVQLTTSVAGGNGKLFPGSTKFEEGRVVTLTALPSPGWRVKAWTGTDDDLATSNTNTVKMSSAKTVTVEFEQYQAPMTEAGYAAIGDDLTDEYEFADSGSHGAGRNWLEQLATVRLLNFGEFTSWSRNLPRFEGYEYNWARTGTTTETLLNEGQLEGVAAQVAEGRVKLVCILVGNCDFAYNYGAIYQTGYSAALVSSALTRLHTAVSTVLNANKEVKVVVGRIPDWEINPWIRIMYPESSRREWVRGAISEYNRRIEADFKSEARVFLADLYTLSLNILRDNQLTVAGYGLDLNTCGDSPDKLIMADKIHPGTIVQGLIANEFVKAMNRAGEAIVPFTELEILNNAGIYSFRAAVSAGLGKVSPGEGCFPQNSLIPLKATPEKGYRVKAWTGTNNDASTSQSNQVTLLGNQTASVAFEIIPGTVFQLTTTVVGEHGTLTPESAIYAPGTVVALTATPAKGYHVKAWTGTDNDSSTSNTNSVTMSSDKTVTVEFEATSSTKYKLNVSVVGNENGSINPEPGEPHEYDPGTVVNLAATPATGYQVKKWTGTNDDTSKANTNTVTMDSDKVVTVEFEMVYVATYQLTTSVASGTGTLVPLSGAYEPGRVVTLNATPGFGYQVRRWTGTDDDSLVTNTNTVTMDGNRIVTVEFEKIPASKIQLQVAVLGGHGTVAPQSGQYDPGKVIALTATPEVGYRVKKWTGTDNDTLQQNTNTVTMNFNRTVTVEFEKYQYQMTVTVIGGHGKVWPLGGYYNEGMSVELLATPDSGYKVKKWTGTDDDGSTQPANAVTINSDRTVTLEFQLTSSSSEGIVGTTPTPTPSEVLPVTTSGCFGSGAMIVLMIFLAGMLLEFRNKD